MTTRRWFAFGGYVVLTWFFGGLAGLVVGAAVVGLDRLLLLRARAYWAASVVLMAMAPFALIAGGLPKTSVAGPGFGTRHMAAHVIVGMALASAAFAALLELLGETPDRVRTTRPRLSWGAAIDRLKASLGRTAPIRRRTQRPYPADPLPPLD